MRRLALGCCFLGSLVVAGCSNEPLPSPFERVATADGEIIGGSPDNTHTAVVAVLTGQSECTGTIIKVSGSNGYVLTAAHCCNDPSDQPEQVALGLDYTNATYKNVIAASVTPDPGYNGNTHDFCMLQFSGASGATPVIPAMTPAQDNLQIGTMLDFVGYGIAGTPQNHDENNSTRMHKTGTLTDVDSLTVEYSEQGNLGGPCNGDSGGPALTLGANPVVAAVTSYGDQNCNVYGVSGRVSGVYNSFILPYLNGQPIQPPPATCDSCATESYQNGGSCYSKTSACLNNAQCSALLDCYQPCNTSQCYEDCNTAHVAGLPKYVAIANCICADATCGPLCESDSFCTAPKCGLGAQDDTCNACIENKCCAQAWSCGVDNTCPSCFGNNPPASCGSNNAFDALSSCLQNSCASQCAGTNTSGSTSSSTSSSGSGNGSGPGAGGAGGEGGAGAGSGVGGGGAGTSEAGAGGGAVNKKSGQVNESGSCAASAPGRDPLPAAPLAGLLIGALAALQRRRRSA